MCKLVIVNTFLIIPLVNVDSKGNLAPESVQDLLNNKQFVDKLRHTLEMYLRLEPRL